MPKLLVRSLVTLIAALLIATEAAPGEPIYPVGGEVRAPVRIKSCEPVFPALRRKHIVQPFFIYETVISVEGVVQAIRTVKRPAGQLYDAIDAAFRRAFRCWRYKPATRRGVPVACRYTFTATVEVR